MIMKTHPRGKKRSKKGAIELSMTTIIIVVIGVTILTLGLRWIYSIFGGLEKQQHELERLTQDQIVQLIGGSNEAISVATSALSSIVRGEIYNLRVVMRNKYSENHNFRYDVKVEGAPGGFDMEQVKSKLTWYDQDISLASGDGFKDFISIDTSGLAIGQYRFRIVLTCLDCTPQKAEEQPVIFQVTLK